MGVVSDPEAVEEARSDLSHENKIPIPRWIERGVIDQQEVKTKAGDYQELKDENGKGFFAAWVISGKPDSGSAERRIKVRPQDMMIGARTVIAYHEQKLNEGNQRVALLPRIVELSLGEDGQMIGRTLKGQDLEQLAGQVRENPDAVSLYLLEERKEDLTFVPRKEAKTLRLEEGEGLEDLFRQLDLEPKLFVGQTGPEEGKKKTKEKKRVNEFVLLDSGGRLTASSPDRNNISTLMNKEVVVSPEVKEELLGGETVYLVAQHKEYIDGGDVYSYEIYELGRKGSGKLSARRLGLDGRDLYALAGKVVEDSPVRVTTVEDQGPQLGVLPPWEIRGLSGLANKLKEQILRFDRGGKIDQAKVAELLAQTRGLEQVKRKDSPKPEA